jgi:hypothetical protein
MVSSTMDDDVKERNFVWTLTGLTFPLRYLVSEMLLTT